MKMEKKEWVQWLTRTKGQRLIDELAEQLQSRFPQRLLNAEELNEKVEQWTVEFDNGEIHAVWNYKGRQERFSSYHQNTRLSNFAFVYIEDFDRFCVMAGGLYFPTQYHLKEYM